jgi:hypothetical protein
MKKELYTWEQLKAYSIIALHNLLHSANEIDLRNINMFLEPLKIIYKKETVIKFSEKLLNDEIKQSKIDSSK